MTHTSARIWQWLGILVVASLMGAAYWYFSVRASTLNAPQNSSITSGLVGLWSFNGDDISGTTAYDRSGSGNNGTLTGGPTTAEGKVGQALDFDGTDDYVTAGDINAIDGIANMSFSAWVKPDVNTARLGVFGKADRAYSLENAGNNDIRIYFGNSGIYGNTTIGIAPVGVWKMWTMTFDGSQSDNASRLKLYVDGVQQTLSFTGTVGATTPSNANTFRIGDSQNTAGGGERYWNGGIDEARLYNTTLTAAQIQSLYALGQSDKSNSAVSQPQGTGRLDSGLAGYWRLDDGSGTSATDSSTNGNTGTLTNGPTWTTGQIGGSVDFDGTDDYITAPTNTIYNTAYITVSAWVIADVGSGFETAFARVNTGANNNCWMLGVGNSANTFRFSVFISNTQYNAQSATGFSTGVWHHLVGTYDGVNVRLYVDGVNTATTTQTGSLDTDNETVSIGSRAGGASPWNGRVDEARIYNRALSTDEISQLYRLTAPTGVDTTLKGYWSFNGSDISGTTAYDRSGAGNNGTLTNGPVITEGKSGQALDFDGSNDYTSIADSTSLDIGDTDDLTLTGWFYRDTFTTDDTIIAKRNGVANTDDGYILFIDDTTDKLTFEVSENSGTDEYLVESKVTFTTAGWHHFAVVWDEDSATNTEIYINGTASVATDTGTIGNLGDLGNAVVMALGAESDAGNPFDGRLDELRLYKRALSTSEIKALYDASEADKVNSSASQPGGTGRLDAGLVGYWPLDTGSGTVATDASGGGNNGTVPNSWTTGQVGSAVSFNGSTTMTVAAGTGVIDAKQDITMAAWVYPRSGGNYQGWFYKGIAGCDEGTAKYMFENDASGYLRIWIGGSSLASLTIPATNQWQHIAATNSAGRSAIYLNGNLVASGAALPAPTSSSQDWTFNKCNTTDANMDEIRIYNRALSADELRQLYQLTTPTGVDTGLKGYWSFNGQDVSGTTAYDRSGAGNTGTLTNGPTITEGKLGQGLSFSGASNRTVTVPAVSSINNMTQKTISFWANSASTGSSCLGAFFSKYYWGFGYSGGCANNLSFNQIFSTTNGTWQITGFSYNVWHHVAITYDRSSVANDPIIYVDGVAVAVTEISTPIGTASSDVSQGLSIGNNHNANGAVDAKMDEFRLYNRILSASEIAALYNSSR